LLDLADGFVIAGSPWPDGHPAVAGSDTNFFVAWNDGRATQVVPPPFPGPSQVWAAGDIYGCLVGTNGTVLTTSALLGSIPAQPLFGPESAPIFPPAVVPAGAGFIAVWPYLNSAIQGRTISAAGTPLSAVFSLSAGSSSSRFTPALASNGTNCLAVWHDKRSEAQTGSDVYGARLSFEGVVIETNGVPVATSPNWQRTPAAAMLDGDYLVVWADKRNANTNGTDIYGVRITAAGAILDPSGIAISTASASQFEPVVTAGDSEFLVVWSDDRNFNTDIYGARVTPAGTVLDPLGIPICRTNAIQQFPAVASRGAEFLVAWADSRAGLDIYGAVVSGGAVIQSNGFPICTNTGTQTRPTVAAGTDDYLVAWDDGRNSATSGMDVYAARVNPSATVLDADGFPVSTAANNQQNPAAAFNGSVYLLVWEDNRLSAASADLLAARISPAGVVLDPSGMYVSSASGQQLAPGLTRAGSDFFAVWHDERNSNVEPDVYGARISSAGTVLDPGGISILRATGYYTQPAVASDGATANALVVATHTLANAVRVKGAFVDLMGPSSGLAGVDVGTPGDPAVAGSTTQVGEGDFDVIAGGSDIWGNADHFHFSYQNVSGDFDAKVRVARLDRSADYAKAGLKVRENLTPGSRHMSFSATPASGANLLEANMRSAPGAGTGRWPGYNTSISGLPYPNVWLRLRRQGDLFTAYRSVDGVNWTQTAQAPLALPCDVLLGLATCAVNNTGPGTVAWYRNFSVAKDLPPSILSGPQSQRKLPGDSLTFTVEACSPVQPVSYQWRLNGSDIPSANAATLTFPSLSLDQAGEYSVTVANAQGSVTSPPALLLIGDAGQPSGCQPPPNNLVAWWRAENNASDFLNRFNGTTVNGVGYAAGRVGQAFSFDGVDDYVSTSLDIQPSAMPSMTWVGWVYPTRANHSVRQTIFSGDDGGFDRALIIELNSFNFALYNGNGTWSMAPVSVNQWQHLAVVYTPTNMIMFKNGVRFDAGFAGTGQASANRFNLGRHPWNGEFFQGRIDEPAVFNRALTDSEIQLLYNAGSIGGCTTPYFIVQPQGRAVTNGASVTLTGLALGPVPISYQWQFNGTNLPGATSTNLVLANVQDDAAGPYTLLASNGTGVASSQTATLIVAQRPVYVSHPQSVTNVVGSTAMFSVTITGSPPFGVRWRRNSITLTNYVLNGYTTSFSIPNVQTANAGTYNVVATNVVAPTGVLSSNAVLTVITSSVPVILAQPADQVVSEGADALFSVAAGGNAPLVYQWYFEETPLGGATSDRLTLAAVSPAQAGNYRVVVTNDFGSVTSAVATLTVLRHPVIVTQPASQSVLEGSNVIFAVTAGGLGLVYQWFFQSNAIPGAMMNLLHLAAVSPAQAGAYHVVVTNNFGAATSMVATLTVLSRPAIVTQPVHRTNQVGTTATFTAVATGTGPLGYRWRFNGTNLDNTARISGAYANQLTITDVRLTDAGGYSLVVSNAYGMATSAVAILTVPAPPAGQTVAHWRFEEGSDQQSAVTPVLDSVGANHLTAESGLIARYRSFTPNPALPVGSSNNLRALEFTGQALGLVTTGAINNFTAPAWTLEAFVYFKTDSLLGDGNTFIGKDGPPAAGADLYFQRNGRTATFSIILNDGHEGFDGFTTVVLGRWYHVAAVTDGTNLALYVDGVLDRSVPMSQRLWTNGTPWTLGRGWWRGRVDPFNGYLDEVRLTERALAPSEFLNAVPSTPPSITQQPTSQTVACGAAASFTVSASSVQPLRYQWFLNATNAIDAGTNATLVVASARSADAGAYTVVVSNALGIVTSAAATLTVVDTTPPSILCPTNLLVVIPASSNEVAVTYSAPVAEDDCSPVNVVCAPPSGAAFAPGTNRVLCVVTDAAGHTNACPFEIVVNRVPVPGSDTMVAIENYAASVLLVDFLRNDLDPDGHALTIVSAGPTSTNGSTVMLTPTNIIYSPVPGFTGADRFSYMISDGSGGLATTEVLVSVVEEETPAFRRIVQFEVTPGRVEMSLLGIPGQMHVLERTSNLQDWEPVASVAAPPNGLVHLLDPNPPGGTAFYRVVAR
jgi:regulation of enolase protein 1 (concanavalin A-like superfamily)